MKTILFVANSSWPVSSARKYFKTVSSFDSAIESKYKFKYTWTDEGPEAPNLLDGVSGIIFFCYLEEGNIKDFLGLVPPAIIQKVHSGCPALFVISKGKRTHLCEMANSQHVDQIEACRYGHAPNLWKRCLYLLRKKMG